MKKKAATRDFVFDKQYLWITAMIVATIMVYLPSLGNSFTNWDDGVYIQENPFLKSISWSMIKGVFSTFFMGNYHPLAMLSLALDYQVNKFDPFVFHLTNLLLHLANSLLVYFSLKALTNRVNLALAAAFLFGLHALHVESVAWVSERKDVLYAFFYLLAMYSYIRYTGNGKGKWYAGSMLFFLLSCLSKGQAVTFAFTLLLIDFFKDRAVFRARVIVEKIPFFLLSILFGIIALNAQRSSDATTMVHFPFFKQVAFASYGLVVYLLKLVLPVSLSAFYAYPIQEYTGEIPVLYWACIVPALGVIAGLWISWRRSKEIFFALGFFLLNIIFLLQIFPVGSAIMADRYTYIPSIGYCFLFGWLFDNNMFMANRKVALAVAAGYLLLQGVVTFNRTPVWQNSMVLWTDVISKDARVPIAWFNRGNIRVGVKDYKNAITDYQGCLKADPNYLKAYVNLGDAKSKMLDFDGAIAAYDELLRKDSTYTTGYINRAMSEKLKHDLPGSLADYNTAIRQKPGQVELYTCRGSVRFDMKDYQHALADYDKAISMSPGNPVFYSDRAMIKKSIENFQGALDDYSAAISLDSGNDMLYNNRGSLFLQMGDPEKAIKDFTEAIRCNPKESLGFRNRGNAFSSQKKYTESITDLSAAITLNSSDAESYFNRAAARKEIHNTEGARNDLQKAITLDPTYAASELCTLMGMKAAADANLTYLQCANMGQVFERQGKLGNAVRQYRRAVELQPDYATGWHYLAKVLARSGQFPEAINCFNKSIGLKKNSFEALTDRGITKATMGKTEDALKDLNMAISMNPGYSSAYFNRALVYLNMHKGEPACLDLKKAMSLGSKDAEQVYQKECMRK